MPGVAFLCVSFLCSPTLAPPLGATTLSQTSASPQQRAAEEEHQRWLDRFTYVAGVVEVIIPDLRLETPEHISDGVDSVAISFPVHLAGLRTIERPWSGGASIFIEPAIPASQTAVRGLAGLRVFGAISVAALVVEGGGIGATDGSGAFVGGGPALGGPGRAMIAFIGRRYLVAGDDRWDFTLDLTVLDMTLLGAFSMDVARSE